MQNQWQSTHDKINPLPTLPYLTSVQDGKSVQIENFSQIWEFWKSKTVFFGPKLFLSTCQVINNYDEHIPIKWQSANIGFEIINLAGNFQKRIKRAARLLDRLEYMLLKIFETP